MRCIMWGRCVSGMYFEWDAPVGKKKRHAQHKISACLALRWHINSLEKSAAIRSFQQTHV